MKGVSAPELPGQQIVASESVPMPGFRSCPGPLVPWQGAVTGSQVLLVSGVSKD